MGKFSHLIDGKQGYFREGEEDEFPWNRTDRKVWYSLFTVEEGRIQHYGFTPSKSNKAALCSILQQLTLNDQSLLLGIWNGDYSTHLFILDLQKAINKLKEVI